MLILARQKNKKTLYSVAIILLIVMVWPIWPAGAAEVRSIIFPVIGSVSFRDDFGDPRVGHTHEGNDIFGQKTQPLIAAVDGIVRFVAWPQPEFGYMVSIEDEDGYSYRYLHINNDHLGADDGLGGGRFAYAPGMESGNTVVKGQLIGWMGDSGNAENTPPHLHFEIRDPDGDALNPYISLVRAPRLTKPIAPPALTNELLPYGELRGGSNIAYGEIDGDVTTPELITGAGPGGGPHIRVFRSDDTVVSNFFAYPGIFRGGVDVAAGDVDGDGLDEIITAPGAGGGPQLKIFSRTGEQQIEFYAFSASYLGGIRVAAADLDGDGKTEIIAAAGPRMVPMVRVFSAAGEKITEFMAYDPLFRAGLDVAAIGATEANSAVIVTGPGEGGGPDVRVFDPAGTLLNRWHAYDRLFRGGVRVSVADVLNYTPGEPTTVPEIFTVPASRGGAHARGFSLTGELVYSKFYFEPWWGGGYDIAAGLGSLRAASGITPKGIGGRRASIINLRPPEVFLGE